MTYNLMSYLQRAREQQPEKTAFSDGESALSYEQLWQQVRSAGSAIHRQLNGARRESVFVCISRHVESVVAFFSVVASGNFYVPIDPSLPDSRLADIFRTMAPALVITTRPDTRPLPFEGAEVLSLQQLCAQPGDEELMDRVAERVLDTDPLYCIFTSGSTGIPKGVLVSHRSVVDMVEQFSAVFPLDSESVFGNQAPFDFDVSVKDIYLAVRNAATVHILEKSLFTIPKRLVQRLNEQRVNTLIWSVSALRILSALKTFQVICPEHLRLVMFSGEALPCKVLSDWQDHLPGVSFVNLYGPTEITCNCSYYPVTRSFDSSEALPIGRPFPNTGIMLLDGDRLVSDVGQSGEICVTGSCLALGYYGDAQRTAAAFCQNPLQNAWPERMYRTGDLGCWNEEGELMFLGRADSQVKHMGFRIELSEIEIAANAPDFVSAACCLYDHAREQLCLFYQAEEQNDKALLAALRQRLPAFMLPKRLYYFSKLPENRTGKIDRAALRRDYLS